MWKMPHEDLADSSRIQANARDNMEALITAVKDDSIQTATFALASNVLRRVNNADKDRLLSECRSKRMVDLLVTNGYVPTAATLCKVAGFKVKHEVLGWLLEYGLPVDGHPQRYANWETPLMCASREGALTNVKLLLTYDADPRISSGREMWTALHCATSSCSSEWQHDPSYFQYSATVEALIDAGANVDGQCDTGTTPLMFASRSRNPNVCALLLRHGANPNAIDLRNKTALDHINGIDPKLFAFDANPAMGIENAKLVVELLTSAKHLSPASIDLLTGEIAGR